ncbi:MAG: hypothetical protein MUF04_11155 [Akkermansiaceae bacterium]|jgi:hypothetical protein|nr:hypothetical protein [Akkermansiaceae bacterium]
MKTNTRNPLLTTAFAALAAGMAHAGILYFDGGTANITTDGDGVGAGAAGT